MDEQDTPNVLAVGARLANLARAKVVGDTSDASLSHVETARDALALLRVVPFDLVAIGDEIGDAAAVEFARRLVRAKPWQKWLMVSDEELSDADEATLRSLGATAILGGPDAWHEVVKVAQRLRRSRPETTVPGLKLEPART